MIRAQIAAVSLCIFSILLSASLVSALTCTPEQPKQNCNVNGAITEVCGKCPQQQETVTPGSTDTPAPTTNASQTGSKTECDKVQLNSLTGGIITCWKEGVIGGKTNNPDGTPVSCTAQKPTCSSLRQQAVDAMKGGSASGEAGLPGSPSGETQTSEARDIVTAIDKAYEDVIGKAFDPSSIDPNANNTNGDFTPEVKEGLVNRAQESLSRIADYFNDPNPPQDLAGDSFFQQMRDSFFKPLDLSFKPEDFAGPDTPDWMARAGANIGNESSGAVNPNTPYYTGSGQTTFGAARDAGIIPTVSSESSAGFGTAIGGALSNAADTISTAVPAMWQSAKETAQAAWDRVLSAVTPSDANTSELVPTEFPESPFSDIAAPSSEGIISSLDPSSSGADPGLPSLIDPEQFAGATPEQIEASTKRFLSNVVNDVKAGKEVDLDTLNAARAVAESNDERGLWARIADNFFPTSERAQTLSTIDAAIAARSNPTSPENLANLAENATGPGRQGILNQANPAITTNEQGGLPSSPSGSGPKRSVASFNNEIAALDGEIEGQVNLLRGELADAEAKGIARLESFNEVGEKGGIVSGERMTFPAVDSSSQELQKQIALAESKIDEAAKSNGGSTVNTSCNGAICQAYSFPDAKSQQAFMNAREKAIAPVEGAIQQYQSEVGRASEALEGIRGRQGELQDVISQRADVVEDLNSRISEIRSSPAVADTIDKLYAMRQSAMATGQSTDRIDGLINEIERGVYSPGLQDYLARRANQLDTSINGGSSFEWWRNRSTELSGRGLTLLGNSFSGVNQAGEQMTLVQRIGAGYEGVLSVAIGGAGQTSMLLIGQENLSSQFSGLVSGGTEGYQNARAIELSSLVMGGLLRPLPIDPGGIGPLRALGSATSKAFFGESPSLAPSISAIRATDFNPGFVSDLDGLGARTAQVYAREAGRSVADEVSAGTITPESFQATAYTRLYNNLDRSDLVTSGQGDQVMRALSNEMASRNIPTPTPARAAQSDIIVRSTGNDVLSGTLPAISTPSRSFPRTAQVMQDIRATAYSNPVQPVADFTRAVVTDSLQSAGNIARSLLGRTASPAPSNVSIPVRTAAEQALIVQARAVAGADVTIVPAASRSLPNDLNYEGLDSISTLPGQVPVKDAVDFAAEAAAEWLARPLITEVKQGTNAALSTAERLQLRNTLENISPEANVLYESNKLRSNSITAFQTALDTMNRSLRGNNASSPIADELSGLYDAKSFPAGRAYDELPIEQKLAVVREIDSLAQRYLDTVAPETSFPVPTPANSNILQRVFAPLRPVALSIGLLINPLTPSVHIPGVGSVDLPAVSSPAQAGQDDVSILYGKDGTDTSRVEIGGRTVQWRNVDVGARHVAAARELNDLGGMKWEGVREVQKIKPELFNDVPVVDGKPDLSQVVPEKINIVPCDAPYACFASHADAVGMVSAKLDYQPAYANAKTYNDVVRNWVGTDVINGSFDDLSRLRHAETGGLTLTTPIARGDLAARAALTKGIFKAEYPNLERYGVQNPITDEVLRDGLAKVFGNESAQSWYAQNADALAVASEAEVTPQPVSASPVVTPAELLTRAITADIPPRAPVGQPQLEAINPLQDLVDGATDLYERTFTPSEAAAKDVVKSLERQRPYISNVKAAALVAEERLMSTKKYAELRENAARELSGRRDGQGKVSAEERARADAVIAEERQALNGAISRPTTIAEVARLSGRPEIPGLEGKVHFLHPLLEADNIPQRVAMIMHQMEGTNAAGAARAQAARPDKRGAIIWVERNGDAYWSAPEYANPSHIRAGSGLRSDNRFIDNSETQGILNNRNTIGIEFAGNPPGRLTNPLTPEQLKTAAILGRFIQERYGIPSTNVYAHSWIQYKAEGHPIASNRYVEGAAAANVVRMLGYRPGIDAGIDFTSASDRALVETAMTILPTGNPMDSTVMTALRESESGVVIAEALPPPAAIVETALGLQPQASPFTLAAFDESSDSVFRSLGETASPFDTRPRGGIFAQDNPTIAATRPTTPDTSRTETYVADNSPAVGPRLVNGATPKAPPARVQVAVNESISDANRTVTGGSNGSLQSRIANRALSLIVETPIALGNGIERVSTAVQEGVRGIAERVRLAFNSSPNPVREADLRAAFENVPRVDAVSPPAPIEVTTVARVDEIPLIRADDVRPLIESPFAITARPVETPEIQLSEAGLDVIPNQTEPLLQIVARDLDVAVAAAPTPRVQEAFERAEVAAKKSAEAQAFLTRLETSKKSSDQLAFLMDRYFIEGKPLDPKALNTAINSANAQRAVFENALAEAAKKNVFTKEELRIIRDAYIPVKRTADELNAPSDPKNPDGPKKRDGLLSLVTYDPAYVKSIPDTYFTPQKVLDGQKALRETPAKLVASKAERTILENVVRDAVNRSADEAKTVLTNAENLAQAEQLRIASRNTQILNQVPEGQVFNVSSSYGTWRAPVESKGPFAVELTVVARVPVSTPSSPVKIPTDVPTPRPLTQDAGVIGTNRQPRVGESLPNELDPNEVPPALPGETPREIRESSISINPERAPEVPLENVPPLAIGDGPLAPAVANPTVLARAREAIANAWTRLRGGSRETAAPPQGDIAPSLTREAQIAEVERMRSEALAIRDRELAYKMEILGRALAAAPDASVVAKLDEAIAETTQAMSKLDQAERALAQGDQGIPESRALVTEATGDTLVAADALRAAQTEEIRGLLAIANERAAAASPAAKSLYDSAARNLEDADAAWRTNTPAMDIEAKAAATRAANNFKAAVEAERAASPALSVVSTPVNDNMIARLDAWKKGGVTGGVPPGGSGGGGAGAGSAGASPGDGWFSRTAKAVGAWCISAIGPGAICTVVGAGLYGIVDNAVEKSGLMGEEERSDTSGEDGTSGQTPTNLTNPNDVITTGTPDANTGDGTKSAPAEEEAASAEKEAKEKAAGAADESADTSGGKRDVSTGERDSYDSSGGAGLSSGGGRSSIFGSGSGGFLQGGTSLLGSLFQSLVGFFGGGSEEEDNAPQTPSVPPQIPEAPVGTIVANPSLIDAGTTTRLSWSSVGTDAGSTTCAVINADFSVFARGGQNGTISSPTLTESTRFGVVCNVSQGKEKLLNETLVRVRGDETDPPRIFGAEQVNAIVNSATSGTNATAGTGATSGTGASSGGGQSGNATPEDVRTCEPEQPIDSFIRCLCEAEPNPAGCSVPAGGLR